MICIKKIEWLDYETKEAEVVLTDGKFEFIVFSHPFEGSIELPLGALYAENIKKATKKECFIQKTNSYYSYLINGKLINKACGLVKLGEFTIEIDNIDLIPDEVMNGEYISFEVLRLDM